MTLGAKETARAKGGAQMFAKWRPAPQMSREIMVLALWLALFLSCFLIYALMYVKLIRHARNDHEFVRDWQAFPRYLYHGN